MNTSIGHALTLAAVLAALIGLTACQSVPQTATDASSSAAADPQSIGAKQQEYDKLLQEWKTLKPGLTRLLAIETELNLLIGQLEQLSSSLEQSQSQKKIVATPTPAKTTPKVAAIEQGHIAPVSYPVKVEVPKLVSIPVSSEAALPTTPTLASQLIATQPKVSTAAAQKTEVSTPAAGVLAPEISTAQPVALKTEVSKTEALKPAALISAPNASQQANYALQVASITDAHLLPTTWALMSAKNPSLLAEMEPNFQKINVKNTDYYRLKIGSFSTQQAASQKCSSLKAAGVDCLVVSYTGSNFAQLTDAGKKITVALQP